MDINKKKLIVDEIDIMNSNNFPVKLSTKVVLKKYINTADFKQINRYLNYKLENDFTFTKKFLKNYKKFSNA